MQIGKAIKRLRVREEVTQQQLAKQVGISQGYLSLVEKGEREPDLELVKKITAALNIPKQLTLLLTTCETKPELNKFRKHLKSIITTLQDLIEQP